MHLEETIDGWRARAPISHRIVAKSIDLGCAMVFAEIGHPAAIALAALYVLIGDSFGLGQSLGKRMLRLRTIHPKTGHACSLKGAFLRNWILALPFVFLYFGFVFQIISLIVGGFVYGYECLLLFRDAYGVRIGDIFASTEVIKLDAQIREPMVKTASLGQQPLFGAEVARNASDPE